MDDEPLSDWAERRDAKIGRLRTTPVISSDGPKGSHHARRFAPEAAAQRRSCTPGGLRILRCAERYAASAIVARPAVAPGRCTRPLHAAAERNRQRSAPASPSRRRRRSASQVRGQVMHASVPLIV
ncbi:hypothetical protein Sfulv_25380 [Streptomyces fulvorobeus]|uniref:Uncharacterized protein n=1 Tax=Streptomyces fulvorobeus TaxID=284028 RepID=A0A7J0C6E8_9ACTN|nr:hypothetical protein Sfulv_25380 [Streptomyces fulvorobeus]